MNEDGDMVEEKAHEQKTQPIAEEEGQSDTEYQSIPKKRKARGVADSGPQEGSEEPLEFAGNVQTKSGGLNRTATGDDTDWLKLRTGQLLGLDENQDGDGQGAHRIRQPASSDSEVPGAEDTDQGQTEAASSPPTPVDDHPGADTDVVESQIRSSKRLFLRNLPFTITEEALMDEFSPSGRLEEVRQFHFIEAQSIA
jgi:hypothetical protein